jgi:hypothetical protein
MNTKYTLHTDAYALGWYLLLVLSHLSLLLSLSPPWGIHVISNKSTNEAILTIAIYIAGSCVDVATSLYLFFAAIISITITRTIRWYIVPHLLRVVGITLALLASKWGLRSMVREDVVSSSIVVSVTTIVLSIYKWTTNCMDELLQKQVSYETMP